MQYHEAGSASTAWDSYWFEKNLQGDIVAIYNASGTKLVSYIYDAWGNFTPSEDSTSIPAVVTNNPFTYRGYYYDYELGLYYLQSRYYDSNTGRFISADSYVNANGDIVGFNMYAYCSNNPVMFTDATGEGILFWLVCIAVTVIISANVGTVIASEITVSDESIEPMSDEELEKFKVDDPDSETGDKQITYGMTRDQQLAYVRRIRQDEPERYRNWTEAEMMREIVYHDRGYRLMRAFGLEETKTGERLSFVDFEEEKTFKTYFFRMFGNCMFW